MKTAFLIIVSFLLIICAVSCGEPALIDDPGHNDYSDAPDTQNAAPEQQGQIEQIAEQTPLPLPPSATDSPADFLNFLDSVVMQKAEIIVLTEDFLEEFNDYQDMYYEDLYKYQQEPSPLVSKILGFMDKSVGGNYLYGGQGHVVTRPFVLKITQMYPEYMDGGRKEYFLKIADKLDIDDLTKFPVYPDDYSWDCSGLWWDCCNTLGLYDEYTDRTANQTYEDFCTPIEKDQLQPGDLVFYRNIEGKITHMGIMGEKGYIYEAASGFVGVVKQRSLDARIYTDIVRGGYLVFPTWNEYGRPIIYQ